MAIYVGLDVSLEDTHYCIHDHSGKRLAEGKVVTDPDEVQGVLEPFKDELERVGLEAPSRS